MKKQITTPEEAQAFWDRVTVLWECEDIEEERSARQAAERKRDRRDAGVGGSDTDREQKET